MRLQNFNEVNNFCFTALKKLSALLNDTAVMRLLLTEFDISYIIKVDLYFKFKFKLKFTVYKISEITQQLTNITELFSTIWKNHDLSVNHFKQNWMAINFKENTESQSEKIYSILHYN